MDVNILTIVILRWLLSSNWILSLMLRFDTRVWFNFYFFIRILGVTVESRSLDKAVGLNIVYVWSVLSEFTDWFVFSLA